MQPETLKYADRCKTFWMWARDGGEAAAIHRWNFLKRRDGPPPDTAEVANLPAPLFEEIKAYYGPQGPP